MRRNQPSRWRRLAYFFLIVGLIAMTAYVWVVANPAPSHVYIPIPLSYPPQAGATFPGTGILLSFVLDASSTIAEGTNISVVNATGETLTNYYSGAYRVVVGFQDAIPSSFRSTLESGGLYIGGLSGVTFNVENYTGGGIPIGNGNQVVKNLVPVTEDTFYFPVAGDYSPVIQIYLPSGTLNYTYNEITVNVLSASEIQVLHYENLNVALTVALLAVAYVEAIKITYDYVTGH